MKSVFPEPVPAKGGNNFAASFLFIFLPLTALAIPLFFHQSEDRFIGWYSREYFFFLCLVGYLTFILSFYTARCGRIAVFTVSGIIIAAVIILALTETALRLKFNDSFAEYKKWGHKRSIIFGMEAKPDNRWEYAGAVYTTDALGFRTHTIDDHWRNAEGIKIFTLGGSSVFGHGLNDDRTWSYGLENYLQKTFSDKTLHVINAGNNGHDSLQTMLRFYLRVLPLKPTHAIFYEGYNDVSLNKRSVDSIGITENVLFSTTLADYLSKEFKTETLYERTILFHTLRENDLLNYLFNLPRAKKNKEPVWDWSIQENNGSIFMRNIRALSALCASNGVKLILTTFIYDTDKMPENESRALKYYNGLLKDFAAQEQIPMIDLEAHFAPVNNKASYFFGDHYHPNQKGADFIAKNIGHYFVTNPSILDKM